MAFIKSHKGCQQEKVRVFSHIQADPDRFTNAPHYRPSGVAVML